MYISEKWFYRLNDNKLFKLTSEDVNDVSWKNCNYIAKELPKNKDGRYNFNYNACLYDKDFEDVTKKDNHIYELLHEDCRCFYFDTDCFKYNPIDETTFISIVNRLVVLIQHQLFIDLDYDDFAIKVNDDYKTEGVKSFHLICKKYCMEFLQLKQLVKIVNHLFRIDNPSFFKDDYIDKDILDDCIYTKNRLMRCLGQSKRKQKDLKINDYTFVLYNNETKTFKDTIIRDVSNSIKLDYLKEYDVWKRPFTIQHIHSVATNKTLVTISTDKQSFKSSFDLLGVKFWGNKSNWICATRIVCAEKLYDMDDWNTLSVENGIKGGCEYTIDRNKEFIETIDPKQVKSGRPLLTSIMNECSDDYIFLFDYDKYITMRERVKEYILHHNLNITIPPPTNLKLEKVVIDDYEINYRNGFITDLSLTKRLPKNHNKINFGVDLINKSYDTLYPQVKINDIIEIIPYVDDFISNDEKVFVVESKWATGKSAVVMMRILKHIKTLENNTKDTINVLILTPNNAVACKLDEELKRLGYKSHLKKTKNINISVSSKLICSPQSLAKAEKTAFNWIFLDEFNMLLSSYDSSNTFIKVCDPSPSYKILLNMCKNANKLVCMDADIEHTRVKGFLYSLDTLNQPKQFNKTIEVTSPTIPKIVLNSQNKYKDYKFDLMTKEHKFKTTIDNCINSGSRIYIAFVSRTKAEEFYNDLVKKYPNKNILQITKFGITRSYNSAKTSKCKYIQKLEHNIINEKVDIFIYSPTIMVGTSINANDPPIFDYGFAYGIHTPIIAQQFLQQFFRVRNLSKQHITILLGGRCWTGYDIKCDIEINKLKLLRVLAKKKREGDKINQFYTADADYYDGLAYTHYKKTLSEVSFGKELLYLMNYHNLNYEFLYDDVKPIKDDKMSGNAIAMIIQKTEHIEATPFSYSEYKNINKLRETDDTAVSRLDTIRLKKTNTLHHMKGVNEIVKGVSLNSLSLDTFIKNTIYYNEDDEFIYEYEKDYLTDLFKARRCYYYIKNTIKKTEQFKLSNYKSDNEVIAITNNSKEEERHYFNQVYECVSMLDVINVDCGDSEITFNDVKLLTTDFIKIIINNSNTIIDWIKLRIKTSNDKEREQSFISWIENFTIKNKYSEHDVKSITYVYDIFNSLLKTLDLKFKCATQNKIISNKYLRVCSNNMFIKHKRRRDDHQSNWLKHLPNNHQYDPTDEIRCEIDNATSIDILKNYTPSINNNVNESENIIPHVKYIDTYRDDDMFFNNSINNIQKDDYFKDAKRCAMESRERNNIIVDTNGTKYWFDKRQKRDRIKDCYDVEWFDLPIVIYVEGHKDTSISLYRPYPTYMISQKVKTIMNTKHITIHEPVDNSLDAYVECMVNDVIDDIINQIAYRQVVLEPNIKKHPLVKQLPLLKPVVDEALNNYMIIV